MSDFVNGVFIGITQTVIGYPFDTLKVFKQTGHHYSFNKQTISRLYRGISYPLIGSCILNSVQFGTYQYCTEKYHLSTITSGFISGCASAVVSNPIDIYKIKYQLFNDKKKIKFWKGIHVTFARESLSSSIYFSSYHYLNRNYNPFISGGIAGMLSWLLTYPIDVIKTRVQSNNHLSMIGAYKMGNIWSGLSFCLLRSFIVNGSGFAVYDYLKDN